MLIWQRTTCNYSSGLTSMHASWLLNFFNSIFNHLLISQRYNFICFFQPCDTVEIAEQLPASPLPPKSDVPAKFFSSNSSSSIKEVEVPDENVRQSPIGAETSDEELHATLVGDDDWEPWEEDEELCASPNRPYSIQFDENLNLNFKSIFSS